MLKLENIQGGYLPGSLVLQGIDLGIAAGEVLGVIGLNGCGKSTLGKAIMNMLPYREGKVIFKGNDMSKIPVHRLQQSGMAMMMQGGRIFQHMTVLENLQIAGNFRTKAETKKKLEEIENQLGLTKFMSGFRLNRKGSYLSGGERLQLALAMVLINSPQLLILDEVSAGLSPEKLEMVASIIEKLKAMKTMSIMLIEQNIRIATRLSDRLVLLEHGIIDQEFKVDEEFDMNLLNENIFN